MVGNEVLHSPCGEVTEFGDELAKLIADMFATMRGARGVGLAANQIGVPLSVFVYLCPESYGPFDAATVWHAGHVVNPVLETPAKEAAADTNAEGCLSVPGPNAKVRRSARVTVRGRDLEGNEIMLEGMDLLARCFQHERDHLRGRLYTDHLSAQERGSVLDEMRKTEPAYPIVANASLS
jgi:peptide deformylase